MSKKGKVDPEELKHIEDRDMFAAKVWALKSKIGYEQGRKESSAIRIKELQNEIINMKREIDNKQSEIYQLNNKMREQYNKAEGEIDSEITELELIIEDQNSKIKEQNNLLKDLKEVSENKIKEKDEIIINYKLKIEEMSNQFSNMLKETLVSKTPNKRKYLT